MDYRHFFEVEVGIQKIKYRGSQGLGCCPLHDDTKPSFSFNIETGQCKCFSGCWQGNAYLLAKELNMENPRQYIDSSTIDSKNYISPPYEPINTLKSQNKEVHQVDKMNRYNELKERYGNRVELGHPYKDKYVGKDDDGNMVFIYSEGIKVHKKYWIPDASLNSSNQIFMADEMSGFDKSRLYLFEGEKDAISSPLKGVSFSCGATSIPDNIDALYDFDEVVIVYDHDEAGKTGAKKVADRIKSESPTTRVLIAQWDESLPTGYDVYDDIGLTASEETDKAIINAKEYQIETETKKQTKPNDDIKEYELMTMKDFIDKYKGEDTAPIIEHLVGEKNITLISGDVDVGKTWVASHIGLSIATGKPFFDTPVKEKKNVVVFQFELTNGEWADRMQILSKTYGCPDNFEVKIIDEDAEIFVDAWLSIEKTILNKGITNSVIIVDNLYTSTDLDVSKNADLRIVIKHARRIINKTNNAMILVGHHNKNKEDKLKILEMDLIQGGRTLTANVNYVLQLGKSTFSPDVKRGKITKTRGGYYEMKDIPFMVHFEPDTGMFRKGVIITNESAHCIEYEKRWEIEVAKDFASYQKDKEFDKARFWQFLSTEQGWERTDSNNTKVSRLLKTLVTWGIFKHPNPKKPYNSYRVDLEAIATLSKDIK